MAGWTCTAALALALAAGDPAGAPLAERAARPVNPMDFGARGDGRWDDTDAFERAAASGKPIAVPRPPAHYRITRKIRLRASIVGEGLPLIRMIGAAGKETHAAFEVRGHTGPRLVIRGLHLDGQWDGGTAGEWSHNIVVKGSRNVTIEDNVLERPYGDNILIGGEGVPEPSEDVIIRRNKLIDPRRCAIAVISARGVRIEENVIRKRSTYVSAIDLEPNPNGLDAVWDVAVTGNDLDVADIAVQVYTFAGKSPPSGRVTLSGNTARASRFFVKPAGAGPWSDLTLTGNTFLGGGKAGWTAFLDVTAPVRSLRVERNRIRTDIAGRDLLAGVEALELLDNDWSAPPTYRIEVKDSPSPRFAGNRFTGFRAALPRSREPAPDPN